jgi:hypothetical protein
MASGMHEGVSRAADTAADYASDVKDRISETAADYSDSVSEFAGDARRAVSERAERWQREARSQVQEGVERVLREQPLAVAVAGLAAGVAVAALLPATRMENEAFGGARDALTDAAGKAGGRVREAAGKAGERLKEAAEERGLSADGLKKMASEVADTFTSEVKGKADTSGSASTAPDRSTSRPGQSFGREQSARDHNPTTNTPRPGFGTSRRPARALPAIWHGCGLRKTLPGLRTICGRRRVKPRTTLSIRPGKRPKTGRSACLPS